MWLGHVTFCLLYQLLQFGPGDLHSEKDAAMEYSGKRLAARNRHSKLLYSGGTSGIFVKLKTRYTLDPALIYAVKHGHTEPVCSNDKEELSFIPGEPA